MGTLAMRLDNNLGTWEGISTGEFRYTQTGPSMTLDAVAHGTGGEVEAC